MIQQQRKEDTEDTGYTEKTDTEDTEHTEYTEDTENTDDTDKVLGRGGGWRWEKRGRGGQHASAFKITLFDAKKLYNDITLLSYAGEMEIGV